jgi:hypothetical protein
MSSPDSRQFIHSTDSLSQIGATVTLNKLLHPFIIMSILQPSFTDIEKGIRKEVKGWRRTKEVSSEWWRRPGGKRSLQIHLNNATAGRESRGRREGGGGRRGRGSRGVNNSSTDTALCDLQDREEQYVIIQFNVQYVLYGTLILKKNIFHNIIMQGGKACIC